LTLRFDPDPTSATAIRRDDPDWAQKLSRIGLRDEVTHHVIPGDAQ
jgi:nicotinate-nucleotide adenylyltransferase